MCPHFILLFQRLQHRMRLQRFKILRQHAAGEAGHLSARRRVLSAETLQLIQLLRLARLALRSFPQHSQRPDFERIPKTDAVRHCLGAFRVFSVFFLLKIFALQAVQRVGSRQSPRQIRIQLIQIPLQAVLDAVCDNRAEPIHPKSFPEILRELFVLSQFNLEQLLDGMLLQHKIVDYRGAEQHTASQKTPL